MGPKRNGFLSAVGSENNGDQLDHGSRSMVRTNVATVLCDHSVVQRALRIMLYVSRNISYEVKRPCMIQNFKDRDTRRFFEGVRVARFQAFADPATHRLTVLESADTLRDLAGLRSNQIEALHGDRADQHSIWINKQWRICFRWSDNGPCDVEIVDYH